MERKGRIKDMDRSFDVEYWQRQGSTAIFAAAWQMVVDAEPRYTKDLEIWVEPSNENAEKVHRALAQFGAPMIGMTPQDFATEGLFYQMGRPPIRVDILTSIDGVSFAEAWPKRTVADFGGVQVAFIGLAELIRNKKSTGRLQDLADAERLEEASGPIHDP